MKKLYSYQYMSMLFLMPLIAVFAVRRGVSWGEWLLLVPLGAAALIIMWTFLRGRDVYTACAAFGKLQKAASAVFAIAFAAAAGGVLAVCAKYAAETIFHSYPPWIVAIPIAAACAFGAIRGTSALGRAGFVFALAAAAAFAAMVAILVFFGRKENAAFYFDGRGAAAAAVFMADGLSAAALKAHASPKRGLFYCGAYVAGALLGGAFLAATAAVSETRLPLENAGGLVRLGTLLTPLTQLAAFFIAVYRISVGISAAGECAHPALGIKQKSAVALSGAAAAAFAALFIFLDAPIIYAIVYGAPVLMAATGAVFGMVSARKKIS